MRFRWSSQSFFKKVLFLIKWSGSDIQPKKTAYLIRLLHATLVIICCVTIISWHMLTAYKTKPSDHFIFYFLLWWWYHGSLGSAVCSIWWRFGWMPYARMHANIMHINVRVIVISSWSLAWSGLAKQEQKHRNLHTF